MVSAYFGLYLGIIFSAMMIVTYITSGKTGKQYSKLESFLWLMIVVGWVIWIVITIRQKQFN